LAKSVLFFCHLIYGGLTEVPLSYSSRRRHECSLCL